MPARRRKSNPGSVAEVWLDATQAADRDGVAASTWQHSPAGGGS